jgi:hypothetical protein
MAVMQLGDLRWRVDPTSVDWSFQLDTAVINTLGGQVIQLLGATLSDLTVSGDFGELRGPNHQASWQLAAAFHRKIKSMMDRQTLPAKTLAQSQSAAARAATRRSGVLSDVGTVHDPLPLTFHDGVHNWAFRVLIKALEDEDGTGSLNISTGKFSYGYKLTLFVVQTDSDLVKKIASDYFLSRISDGLGWKQSTFNGPKTAAEAQSFITTNGGSIAAYLDKILGDIPAGG